MKPPSLGSMRFIFPKRSRSAKGEIAFDDDDDARVVYIESTQWGQLIFEIASVLLLFCIFTKCFFNFTTIE